MLKYLVLGVAIAAGFPGWAIDASDRYRSPRNPERAIRRSTELIVLHTTEAAERGSLNKLSDRGECHFVVTEDGSVYRIIDRDKEAFHSGRSMWNGKEDVDKFSIGIECVGYHDKPMPMAQINAIAQLVKELKAMYRLSDEKVVSHCHVAYGAPNKWQKRRHRGRKRCGMLFTTPTVRNLLGLRDRPASDADVRAKRLVVGDAELNKVVYGKRDPMRGRFAKGPVPQKKDSGIFSWFGSKGKAASASPPKATPKEKIRSTSSSAYRTPPRSVSELKERGFTMIGAVDKGVTASQLAGAKWNDSNTYYAIRNKVIPGNILNPARIEKGMRVWVKK